LTRQSSLKIKDVEIVCGDILKPESLLFALDGVNAVLHNAAYAVNWGVKSRCMHLLTHHPKKPN